MSFDLNSLPNDIEELKKIIIFQKQKESEHLDQIERLKIQLFGRKTEK
ncbi:hypothetical protein LEP1GSC089_0088 [Leptospira interrogans serovar Autumnalis str. LP101]|nr:hypothetical protein LEP1GSC089_0088 [Leptospira interrogans serovar Autumnalis str. LP101]